MEQLSLDFDLDTSKWLLLALAAMFTGMSKTGLGAVFAAVIPIMVFIFGPKGSTGALVPILIFADIMAVLYYRRKVEWKYIIKLLPWTLVGLGIGVWIGDAVPEQTFKYILAGIIVVGAGFMLWLEGRRKADVPDYQWFAVLMGLLGGFSTMVGNFAGPVLMVYLLSMRLPKNIFIGTGAWFFFIMNLVKVPFHVFIWETISWPSLKLDLLMIPFIMVGAVSGIYLVRLFPEGLYRRFTIITTILSALLVFL